MKSRQMSRLRPTYHLAFLILGPTGNLAVLKSLTLPDDPAFLEILGPTDNPTVLQHLAPPDDPAFLESLTPTDNPAVLQRLTPTGDPAFLESLTPNDDDPALKSLAYDLASESLTYDPAVLESLTLIEHSRVQDTLTPTYDPGAQSLTLTHHPGVQKSQNLLPWAPVIVQRLT